MVKVLTNLFKVINRLVTELQGVSGTEAARDREDGAGLTFNCYRLIYTEDGAVHTKDGAVHVNNKDRVTR